MKDVSSEVIERAAAGDVGAFEEIYRTYADHVYNISLRILRNREDAGEIVQEVFVIMHSRLKEFRAESSLSTWLYRVTVNTSINYYRKRGKERSRTVEYDDAFSGSVLPDVTHKAENDYKEGLIRRLLDILSPEQRVCMILRAIEGLTYEQIAAALDVNINVVRSRLKRGREKLMGIKEEVMADEL